MAKRKRLTPARTDYLDTIPADIETKSMGFPPAATRAPIAQVAGDAASASALEELADEMKRARDEGRMIQALPLGQIDETYLQRDRIAVDPVDLHDLKTSIQDRGQQAPIEVVAFTDGRYGLISGWRRLTALRQLHGETGEARFATVQSILRQPNSAADAYVAMVEENEIRLGLSYYERARIAAKAVEQGVYETEKLALQNLFKAASRTKRSKIRSFLTIYHALDAELQFPNAINERFGVALSHALEDDKGLRDRIVVALSETVPESAEAEMDLLKTVSNTASFVSNQGGVTAAKPVVDDTPAAVPIVPTSKPPARPPAEEPPQIEADRGWPDVNLVILGPQQAMLRGKITPEFKQALTDWLKGKG
ncbi:MAG: ParB N-terminal domain-containing protein [Pseudomonadota bacterium]